MHETISISRSLLPFTLFAAPIPSIQVTLNIQNDTELPLALYIEDNPILIPDNNIFSTTLDEYIDYPMVQDLNEDPGWSGYTPKFGITLGDLPLTSLERSHFELANQHKKAFIPLGSGFECMINHTTDHNAYQWDVKDEL